MQNGSHTNTIPNLRQLRASYQAGELTPIDVVTARLNRIQAVEPKISAWESVENESALRAATEQTEMLNRGDELPALFGVTVGVKDIIDVHGLPTRCGVDFTDSDRAACDAPIVSRLRELGAIILGKTVTTPFACFDPAETKNPWNTKCSPGGSSSGSAAAVAAGMVDVAIGTQTGGSIIRPASFCGICGWKPSMGQLSMEGIAPVSTRLDHLGFFAQSPTSLEYLAECFPGDGKAMIGDMTVADRTKSSFYTYAKLETESRGSNTQTPVRLTIVRSLVSGDDESSVIERSVENVRSNSNQPVEVSYEDLPFDLDEALSAHRCIMCYDLARLHKTNWSSKRDRYPSGLSSLIAEGLSITEENYGTALAQQAQCARMLDVWLSNGRILVSLASMGTAPQSLSTTGNPRYNSLFSLTGLPVVTCPVHVDSNGLPIGIQLAAHPSLERQLFDLFCTLDHDVVPSAAKGKN